MGIYGCNESFNHKAKDSSKIHTLNGTRHRHTQTYTHAPGYAKSKNTTQNISPNRISSRSGTINVTVCPLVRSFKAFASYKYIYWQYTVSQQHVAAIDWKFQSQLALQRENFKNAVQSVLFSWNTALALSSCLLAVQKLDKSFSHHEAAAIFLTFFDKSSDTIIELCICACSV